MVNISKIGDSAIKFTFTDNDRYLYNGEITLPLNSLILEFDTSDLVIFKKIDGDVFVTFLLENSNFNSKAELESWYKENAVGSTGGGGTDTGTVQTMIDESISGKADSSAVTEEISAAVSGKVETNTYTAYTATTQAVLNSKLDATAYTPVQVSTAITENDTNPVAGGAVYDKVHVTSGNGSTTLLTFGSEIIPESGIISAATNYQSGVTKFNIELDLTQWGRWSPTLGFRDSNNNNYAGQIINTDGVITYADRSDEMFATSMSATTSYTNNVFTIEVTGLSGDAPSGLTMFGLANIEPVVNAYAVQGESVEYWIKDYVDAKVAEAGGGKAIEAGRGISVATGETADTVSFNLPISAGTGSNSIIVGSNFNEASGSYSVAQGEWTLASGGTSHTEGTRTKTYGIYSHAEGSYSEASGSYSHAEGDSTYATAQASHSEGQGTSATSMASHSEGRYTQANGMGSHSEGYYTIAENDYEHASGKFNASNTGESTSAQTLFSVGNGGWDETLQENVRHNAFEIRQNGDIYCSDGTNDVKLQDTITATTANTTALGGMTIVKITESDYQSLSVKDPDTLYVVIPDTTNS